MIKPKEKNADGKIYGNVSGTELIAINKDNRNIFLVFEDKRLIDIEIENVNELPIGTRCVGKINKISKDINAVFVLLPDKSTAFLKADPDKEYKCENNIAVEIIRASSKGKLVSVKETEDDIEHKSDLTIIELAKPSFSRLFEKYEFDNILTDNDKIYDELKSGTKLNINKYSDNMVSLSALYSVSKWIKEATSKTVWLKSGANIIIENTSAFTVIDVNSSKNTKKNENNYLNVNLEACEEIFRQMNLRNLSGIILVDFINMQDEERTILTNSIKNHCKKQNNYTVLVDITKLGIAEITRKKQGSTIYDLNLD